MSENESPTLFDAALYLVCAARNSLNETLPYASMRLLDGAERLIAAAAQHVDDPFLAERFGEIAQTKFGIFGDMDDYTRALETLQDAFVAEAKRRNGVTA
jgi:hypothetical protein